MITLDQALSMVHQAHERLHMGDVEGAHEILHCGINEKPLKAELADADAAKVLRFSMAFTDLCREYQVAACYMALVPVAPGSDKASLQVGGHLGALAAFKNNFRQVRG